MCQLSIVRPNESSEARQNVHAANKYAALFIHKLKIGKIWETWNMKKI